MKFKNICKSVYDYYEKHFNESGLCSCVDIGEYYVFSAGDPRITNYGGCMITVDKKHNTIDVLNVFNNLSGNMAGGALLTNALYDNSDLQG